MSYQSAAGNNDEMSGDQCEQIYQGDSNSDPLRRARSVGDTRRRGERLKNYNKIYKIKYIK